MNIKKNLLTTGTLLYGALSFGIGAYCMYYAGKMLKHVADVDFNDRYIFRPMIRRAFSGSSNDDVI